MNIFKHFVKQFFKHFGYELCSIGINGSTRRTMAGVLANVARLGFVPSVVIDVGVAQGTFALYNIFPDSYHLLIEPLKEFEDDIKSILRKYKGSYVIAAASSKAGSIEINVHADHLDGSSFYRETMGNKFDGVPRIVQTVRIDDLVKKAESAYLIKIDVQGGGIDVLEGAKKTLSESELVILEVSMFQFMIKAPQFYDVVAYMKNSGFVVYDIFGENYRPLDFALGQIDLVFVKENGVFRTDHVYATPQQWQNIQKNFRS